MVGQLAITDELENRLIHGSCHCGNVTFELAKSPEKLVDCNCSICRRIGALWGHLEPADVSIKAGKTTAYVHGDELLAFHTCLKCGCTTHYENLGKDKHTHMAVNFRMCDPDVVGQFVVRRFDGANSWQFID